MSRLLRIACTLALMTLLAACASTQRDDSTGNLGVEGQESPAQIYVDMGIAYMRDGQDAVALKNPPLGSESSVTTTTALCQGSLKYFR